MTLIDDDPYWKQHLATFDYGSMTHRMLAASLSLLLSSLELSDTKV